MSPRDSSSTPVPAPRAAALAGRLIRFAAQVAPGTLAARLEEEWLADVDAQGSPLARLGFALGCCWAACVITHEHSGVSVLTAYLTAGRTLTAGLQSLLPRRSSAFVLVLCAHLGALHFLETHLAFHPPARPVVVTLQTEASTLPSPLTPDAEGPLGRGYP